MSHICPCGSSGYSTRRIHERTSRVYLPSHKVSKKMLRSSLLISRTLVSNELCRVRALHRSLASRNARPNSLGRTCQLLGRKSSQKWKGGSHFFLVSPKSNAAVTPTTTYVPALSSKQATTNGRLFLLLLDPLKTVPGVLSLNASTNHSANLDSTPGCANNARSGP